MPCPIFNKPVPTHLLYDLLDKVAIKMDTYYILNYEGFRKLVYNKYDDEFRKSVEEYYVPSKRVYVWREFTYKSFSNIIRQICKQNKINIESKIRYSNSDYDIEYVIGA